MLARPATAAGGRRVDLSGERIGSSRATDLCLRAKDIETPAELLRHFPEDRWLCVARVDVSENLSLASLPCHFFDRLPSLVSLSSASCCLAELPALPKNRRLQRLDVSHNRIARVPPTVRFPKLRFLDLSHNHLDCLPAALMSLSALVDLRVNDNRLRSLGPCIGPNPEPRSTGAAQSR